MTIDSRYFPERYTTGTHTRYPFTFEVIDASYVEVFLGDGETRTQLTIDVDYTVELSEYRDPIHKNGIVVLASAPTAGQVLDIERKTAIANDQVFEDQKSFQPEMLEFAADKLFMILQEIEGHRCDCRECLVPDGTLSVSVNGDPVATPVTVTVTDTVLLTTNITGGTAPFTYEWRKDGEVISGETDSTLSFLAAVAETAVYSVTIGNECGDRTAEVEITLLIEPVYATCAEYNCDIFTDVVLAHDDIWSYYLFSDNKASLASYLYDETGNGHTVTINGSEGALFDFYPFAPGNTPLDCGLSYIRVENGDVHPMVVAPANDTQMEQRMYDDGMTVSAVFRRWQISEFSNTNAPVLTFSMFRRASTGCGLFLNVDDEQNPYWRLEAKTAWNTASTFINIPVGNLPVPDNGLWFMVQLHAQIPRLTGASMPPRDVMISLDWINANGEWESHQHVIEDVYIGNSNGAEDGFFSGLLCSGLNYNAIQYYDGDWEMRAMWVSYGDQTANQDWKNAFRISNPTYILPPECN